MVATSWDKAAGKNRGAPQSKCQLQGFAAEGAEVVSPLPTAGAPDRIAVEGDRIGEGESVEGLPLLAELDGDAARLGGPGVELDLGPVEASGVGRELADVRGMDAGQAGVLPERPRNPGR